MERNIMAALALTCGRGWGKCASALLGVLLIVGCTDSLPPVTFSLVGRWQAEGWRIDGVKLPIAPDMTFASDNTLILHLPNGDQKVAVKQIQVLKNEATVTFRDLPISIIFNFEDADAIVFTVPLVEERVRFRRVVERAAPGTGWRTRR